MCVSYAIAERKFKEKEYGANKYQLMTDNEHGSTAGA